MVRRQKKHPPNKNTTDKLDSRWSKLDKRQEADAHSINTEGVPLYPAGRRRLVRIRKVLLPVPALARHLSSFFLHSSGGVSELSTTLASTLFFVKLTWL